MWLFMEQFSVLVSQTFDSKFLVTYSLLKKVNEFVICRWRPFEGNLYFACLSCIV
jgi:hypothetical protein